jgi:thiol-disulfide isomerase/thioredoxin
MIPFNDLVMSVDFSLPGLDGQEYGLKSYPDSLVMLNFWATWCGPCRTEMPSMQALYDDYGSRGLELIAINQREPLSMVQDFMDEFGYTFPVLLDGPGVIGFQYGVRSIPLTYLITPDGRIIAGKPGAQDWNTPKVREALGVLLDYYL